MCGGVFGLILLPLPPIVLIDYLFQLLVFLLIFFGIAMFIVPCKHASDQDALCKQMDAECLELTNCNGNATFQLSTKDVQSENSDNSVLTFSHINVLMNDPVQLTHNVTDDNVMCSEIC